MDKVYSILNCSKCYGKTVNQTQKIQKYKMEIYNYLMN